jgi:hypothetical protein
MKTTALAHIAPSYPQSPADKATHFSPAGLEALRRAKAETDRILREQEQARRDEIEAAYAEYDDQPRAEVEQYLSAAA